MWARRGGGAKREDRMGVGRVENAKIKEQEARSRNLDVVGMDGLTGYQRPPICLIYIVSATELDVKLILTTDFTDFRRLGQIILATEGYGGKKTGPKGPWRGDRRQTLGDRSWNGCPQGVCGSLRDERRRGGGMRVRWGPHEIERCHLGG